MPSETVRRGAWPLLAAAAIVVAFSVTCVRFVAQPGLASFADDSVSYLVMAQVFSPWGSASVPVTAAFSHEAFYPPLFPLVLAFSGAAFDFARAHALCALLLAAALAAQYALAARWLASRWVAVAAVATTALLPSLWINAKGILSEPLFAGVLLLVLLALERPQTLAIAMAALVLTRTLGIPMVVAYAAWAIFNQSGQRRLIALAPVVAAAIAYAAWLLLRPADTADDYARYAGAATHWIVDAGDAPSALAHRLATNLAAIADAWLGAVLLFWVPEQPLRIVLAGAIGALAIAGWVVRLRRGHADGWMLLAYVAVLLLWPFPGQMTRFVFPLLPVLILYAYVALDVVLAARSSMPRPAPALLALLIASLAAPSLAFVHQRANLGADHGYAAMTEWYRTPELREAQARAAIHLGLFDDMRAIRERTRADERVMWVAPGYIALLADRRGVPAPDEEASVDAFRAAVQEQKPDLVFLSAYHPRSTLSDRSFRTGLAALQDGWTPAYQRAAPDGMPQSVLLRPNRP